MFSFFKRKPAPTSKTQSPKPGVSTVSAAPTTRVDEGFDSSGFVFGLATGVPISPARGMSMESVLGASIHNSNEAVINSAAHCDTSSHHHHVDSSSSSIGSFDSGVSATPDTSSSSSFDSGGSCSSGDSGGSW